MATALQLASTLFKSLLGYGDTGVDNDGTLKEWYQEFISARPLVFSNQIWAEVDKIPITAPSLAAGEISGPIKYVENALMVPVDEGLAGQLALLSKDCFHLEDLKNSVPLNFGVGGTYIYTITYQDPDNPGTPLIKSNGDPQTLAFGVGDWFVDNGSGILQFYGGMPQGISRDNPPFISYYKYVGKSGGGGGASITISATAPADAEAGAMWWNSDTGDLLLYYADSDSSQWVSAIGGAGGFFTLNSATSTISTPYTIAAAGKSFKIPHPLPSLSDDYFLMHTSVEAPDATLLYRGKSQLINGRASVNIDEYMRMTEGTFVALSHKPNCHISNNVDWTPVRGNVNGNILTIESKDESCNVEVEWLVTCTRRDPSTYNFPTIDENGVYRPEVPKNIMMGDPKQHIDPIKLEFKE
jgi:hypothetical protein